MTLRREVGRTAQLARLSEIATVLWSSEFGWLVDAMGVRSCVSLRCRMHCTFGYASCPHHVAMSKPLPDRLRAVLEHLGPTFVKAGQMLALRPDYLPLPYAEALRQLHSGAEPFPAAEAMRVIEEELGAPVARLFAEIDPEPFAAASLAQVHRAQLPDGRVVAVKVQRPGVNEQIARDVALLRTLAARVERRRPAAVAFRPTEAVEELAEYTSRELDFRREARTAERIRASFGDEPTLVVPAVHTGLTSRRVLTTDLVEGAHPAPADELRRAGIDPATVLAAGTRIMFRQIFQLGLFHADPHPGNILLLPGNRVCLLDFGMVGRLSGRDRRRMSLLLWALFDGDYDLASDRLLRMATLGPGADVDGFRRAAADLVEDWWSAEGPVGSIAALLVRELASGGAFGVTFPRELMLLARALVTLEATARLIDPAVGLADLAAPLRGDLQAALLPTPDSLARAWQEQRLDLVAIALDLTELATDRTDSSRGAPVPEAAHRPAVPRSGVLRDVALAAGAGYAVSRWSRGRTRA